MDEQIGRIKAFRFTKKKILWFYPVHPVYPCKNVFDFEVLRVSA